MRCIALLCCAILKPFKYGCSHVDSRWGHASPSLRWHSVQMGCLCVRGHNMVFKWLPMYCAYRNLSVWVICAFVTFSFSRSGWIVFGVFGYLIVIYLHMGICFS
jgi:hypothetical protein